ncbi:MAG TPA: SDR family NAD(P)-dependent oxidoreductase [Gammaproteobacteria bacterium]|jgi:NAD(P)-dependent dehydrogenase (short-subunit alcohol dehydrogenase family)
MSEPKSALVVGASKGLGLAIAREFLERGWDVIGTVRAENTELHALAGRYANQLRIEHVDITDTGQVAALQARLKTKTLDILFVNAGISGKWGETVADVSTEDFARVMVTNALSPMRLVETFTDQVRTGGVVGVMSSGQGSVANNEGGGVEVYRASKAALNMLMKSFASRRGKDHASLLLAPGWVKTDLGGPEAKFSIEDVIHDLVDTIIAQEGKTGLRYLDRFGKPVRW